MLQQTAEVLWSAQSDEALVAVVEQAQRLSSVLAAVEAGAVAEADLRGLAKERLHYGSTGDWLTHTGGLRRGEGKRRVVRAHALTGPLTRTQAALVAGEVSATQVDPIVDAVHGLPSGELVRARGEQAMLEHAQVAGCHRAGPAGPAPGPRGRPRRQPTASSRPRWSGRTGPPTPDRFLAITEDRAGGVRIKGYGSTEDAALLKAALLPLTCPTPAADDEDGSGEVAGSSGPRRPALGRPDHHRPARPHHRPAAGDPRHPTPTAGHPRPPDPPRPARRPRDRHHRGRRSNSHPPPCAGWPATPRSSPPSSAPAARSSTSAAPDAWSPPSSGPPWCSGTGTAPSPAAPDPR